MYKKIIILLFIFLPVSINSYANDKSTGLGIGSIEAKVTIKVFSSLTCPHCAHFHEKIYKSLKEEFIDTGKVRFEHHGFPLDLAALNAEKILRCVKNSDKSFQFLSEIYKKQNKWVYRDRTSCNIPSNNWWQCSCRTSNNNILWGFSF